MGKKSGPAAPAAPDPYATAQAQIGVSRDAATTQANLNRINQYTPEGSLTYSIDGYNDDGTPQYRQTTQYSAAEQAKYDQQNQVAGALNGLAVNNIDRVKQAQATPFTYDGMQPLQTQIGGGNPFALRGGANPTGTQRSVEGVGTAQAIDPSLAGQGIQGSLDYSGLSAIPGYGDYGAEGQRMSDAVYQQAASRLDPRFQQIDAQQRSRLAAQGITENSDAYRRALDNVSRDRNDAYNQATYSAVGAGAQEQSRLFGLAMGARQQGQNEVNAQGQFVNSAQAQRYGQQFDAAAQGMAAQGQNVGQRFAGADLYNQSGQQDFDQAQASNAANNVAQNQYFNQSGAQATFGNQARQQQIEQAAYLRNVPLNDISVLLNGNAPSSPNFSSVPQVGVASPDYQGAVQNNYNSAMNQYNQQQASRSQMLGSIFGGLGSIGAAAVSDMRFKDHIRRIGTLANGIATYAFKYIGDSAQRFGVMAQEVLNIMPDAVLVGDDGIMRVDYGKVYA